MNDLNRALVDIQAIRRQVAETTEFRGYGPLTLFATAVVAMAGGVVQFYTLPDPMKNPAEYVALWLTVGLVSAGLIVTQMLKRANRVHQGMADVMIRTAVAQFLPAAVTGLILPLLLLRVNREVFWMLPGLWQIVLGLGVFASWRSMPRLMFLAGAWFLLTGLCCIALGDARALSPLSMAGVFAVGMTLVGAIHGSAAKGALVDEEE